MLSVILYGRNDGHGSNLAKRAVISLNAIASALTDPTDEIIFVDYNTADDLPTFPEAVADMLTDHARALLKIIRVPAVYHDRIASQTPLPVVEAISRNVALRRVRAECKWILFSNTDMIFNPGGPDGSLSTCVSALEAGLYHIPRFEVPESIWEGFHRSRPDEARAFLAEYAAPLGLEVPVLGPPDLIYDYCGDFQLVSRHLIEEIQGFDESMLYRGWCDPNIARRLRMHGYPARSLASEVKGYHCGHHRGAPPPAQAARQGNRNNDPEIYFYFIEDVIPPYQPDDWGLRDEALEVFPLEQKQKFHDTLIKATADLPPVSQPVSFPTERFNSVTFESRAVLPFVADLLCNLPKNTRLLLISCNSIFTGVLTAWAREQGVELSCIDPSICSEQDCAAALAEAEVLIPVYGLEYQDVQGWKDEELDDALAPMDRVTDQFISQEQSRVARGSVSRRYIFVNAERALKQGKTYQNQLWFQAKLAPHFQIALVPLQARVSYGYVRQSAPRFDLMALAPRLEKYPSFSGRYPSRPELQEALGICRFLAANVAANQNYEIAVDFFKPYLMEFLEVLRADEGCPLDTAAIDHILAKYEYMKASARCSETLHVALQPSRPARQISSFANYFSWDAPEWAAQAGFFGGSEDVTSVMMRSGHFWAQIQILFALRTLGLFSRDKSSAIHADDCGRFVQLLQDGLGAAALLGGLEAPFAKEKQPSGLPSLGQQDMQEHDFAISLMHPLDVWGVSALVPSLYGLACQTREQGHVILESDVRLAETERLGCPAAWHYVSGTYQDILSRHAGLDIQGPVDFSFDTVSFDSQSHQSAPPMFPRLVTIFPKNLLVTPAVTVWKKHRAADMKEWRSAQMAVLGLEKFAHFFIQPEKAEDNVLKSRGIALFPGRYRLSVEAQGENVIRISVSDDQGQLKAYSLKENLIEFEMPVRKDAFWSPLWISLEGKASRMLEIKGGALDLVGDTQ